jgi:taurine dioxygenase
MAITARPLTAAIGADAMWDNRCTQHFATNDFWPEHRRMERVTVAGDRPF